MEQELLAIYETYGALLLSYALDLVGAVVLLVGGWIVAGWVRRLLRRRLGAIRGADRTLTDFLASLARYVILIVVLVAVLAQFGIQTASILAVLGTVGLGVGLALQGTLSNVAGGLVLLFLRPFQTGDFVDAGGQSGTVDEIGLFNTHLTTFDGVYLTVPNGQIASSPILNYSRNATRRLDLPVGIAYEDDVEQGLAVLRGLLDEDERVLSDPAPEVMVLELADSSVNLNMRCWTRTGDYWALKFDLTRKAKAAVETAGLSIPFPQHDVHLIGGGAGGNGAVKAAE